MPKHQATIKAHLRRDLLDALDLVDLGAKVDLHVWHGNGWVRLLLVGKELKHHTH